MPTPPFVSVWFDCDCTLATIEGIDELGRLRGEATRRRIAEFTDRAMTGELPLAEIYERRLRELAPTRDECASIGACYIAAVVPDARDVVAALHSLGKTVGIISGGLRPPVLEFARHLGVAEERVLAVPIRFDADGRYLGFDRDSALWRNGGKVEVFEARPANERPICFVGDGVTDLEAAPVVERFIGFGGVARRDALEQACEFYVKSPRLGGILRFALTDDERSRLGQDARFRPLVEER